MPRKTNRSRLHRCLDAAQARAGFGGAWRWLTLSKRSKKSTLSKARSTLKRVSLWAATVVLLVVFCAGGWLLLANVDSHTYLAAERGDLSTLRALKSNDSSIDRAVRLIHSCKGWRPLIIAAAQGHADAVKILLE